MTSNEEREHGIGIDGKPLQKEGEIADAGFGRLPKPAEGAEIIAVDQPDPQIVAVEHPDPHIVGSDTEPAEEAAPEAEPEAEASDAARLGTSQPIG